MKKILIVLLTVFVTVGVLSQKIFAQQTAVPVRPPRPICLECPGGYYPINLLSQAPSNGTYGNQPLSPSSFPSISAINNTTILTLKEKALLRTEQRIADLLAEVNKIGSDTTIPDKVKNSLTSQIQTLISLLNVIRTKIGQDQTDSDIKKDFSQVLSEKVYACFLPKILIQLSDQRLKSVISGLNGMTQNTQSLIESLQSQGVDISQSKALLANIIQQLTTVLTITDEIMSQLPGLNPTANCTQSKATAVTQLEQVKQVLLQIRNEIAQLQKLIDTVRPSSMPSGPVISMSPITPGCYYKPIACPMFACRVGGPCPTCTPTLICPTGIPTVSPVPPPGCYYIPPQPCPCTGKICPMCMYGPRLVCPSGTPNPVTTCTPYPPQCGPGKMCPYAMPIGGWCPITGSGTGVVITPNPTCNMLPCKPGVRCSVPIGC